MECAISISIWFYDSRTLRCKLEMIKISNFMLMENILIRTVGVKHFLAIMRRLSDEFINLVAT